ncbi:MAG: glycosyl transferase [Candidatus Tokpelaia sp. JSC085]|nr:MAG: glycosyl transferase [Candidatus Tokpelaia sp. JSC085]
MLYIMGQPAFMKLYVINLDRSSDRLRRIERLFAQQDLRLTRIQAIDAKDISDADYKKFTERKRWPDPITRGEVACFLSHRLALQQIAQESEAYSAIFEDDVILSSHARFFLKNWLWIPSGVHLIKIETDGKKVWLGPPVAHLDVFTLARLKSTHIMAAAYIVSKKTAAYLAEKMEYVYAPVDHFLFNIDFDIAMALQVHQLDPAIVVQANLTSTLQHDRAQHQYDKKKKRSLLQKLQREMLRIIIRSYTGLWGIKKNMTSNEQWKRIPFDQLIKE